MRASVWMTVLVLALTAALLTVAYADKRAEMSPAPFVIGSRYGRSPQRFLTPRNDRFFMGSRYGKRSEERAEMSSDSRGWSGSKELLCEYMGVSALYRCTRRDRSRLERRSSEEESLPADSD